MKRTHRNMGYWKKMDMDVGLLYPTYVEHLIPGDICRLGQSEVIRAVNPPTAPITDSFKYHTVYVAIPKRILDRHFVRNMTGTKTGDVHGNFKVFNIDQLIKWLNERNPSHLPTSYNLSVDDELGIRQFTEDEFSNGSLYDYFSCDYLQNIGRNSNKINVNNISAYYLAWNFLFRNAEIEDCVAPIWDVEDHEDIDKGLQFLDVYEHLIDEEGCNIVLPQNSPLCRKGLMRVHWRKDYFTDVTLNSQRGTVPTVPITFSKNVPVNVFSTCGLISSNQLQYNYGTLFSDVNKSTQSTEYLLDSSNLIRDSIDFELPNYWFSHRNDQSSYISDSEFNKGAIFSQTIKPNSVVDNSIPVNGLGGIAMTKGVQDLSFSVTDLRSALVISHFMEINNYGGFKWAEFLMSHFGTCPTDESLERPLFLGSFSDDIYTSEVLQQSSAQTDNDTALGHLGGKMIGVGGKKNIVKFRAKEHMVVLGLSWISVERNYESGLNRMWLETDYLDTYFNVFNGLGAQAIDVQELNTVHCSDTAYNFKTKPKNFGFTERYSHLMSRRNEVCGRLRSGTAMVFDSTSNSFKPISQAKPNYEYYYHNYAICEAYSIAGDEELVNGPTSAVSQEFLAMRPQLTDVFTSSTDVPFVVNIYNRADMFRPIPLHCKTGVSYV